MTKVDKQRARKDGELAAGLEPMRKQLPRGTSTFEVEEEGAYHARVLPSGPLVSLAFLRACVYRGFLRAGPVDQERDVRQFEFVD